MRVRGYAIVPVILEGCIGGARITKLMCNVQLSHNQARAYLSELMQLGLLTLDAEEAITYTTTPDGIKYLQRNKTLLELMALA
jgi:predicted transcriptional regulator